MRMIAYAALSVAGQCVGLATRGRHAVDVEARVACDWTQPKACLAAVGPPPPSYSVKYETAAGLAWTIDVTTAWAPPYATRFWALSKIGYHVGAPFYRVDYANASTRFVVQFGYRGDAAVDALWDELTTLNTTWSVHVPGNVRGSVAFSMNAAAPGEPHGPGTNPNCTDPTYCAVGFSTNIFINYGDNTRLNGPGFSVFGTVSEAGMAENGVDALYGGYGECVELCGKGCCSGKVPCTAACGDADDGASGGAIFIDGADDGASGRVSGRAVGRRSRSDGVDPYCRFNGAGACEGVSLTQMLNVSVPAYLEAFPLLDRVERVTVVVREARADAPPRSI